MKKNKKREEREEKHRGNYFHNGAVYDVRSVREISQRGRAICVAREKQETAVFQSPGGLTNDP